jgi:tRNA G37 N-methylase TrmD
MSNNTEQLMRQYPILSAAWDECSMIWKGVEQDGTIHKFNRKAMRKIVKDEQAKVDDRLIGGNDHMINPVGKPGSNERLLALAVQYATLTEQEQSPFGE